MTETENKIRKDEAAFHSKLIKWLEYNYHLFPKSSLFETKVIRLKETRFDISELSKKEEHLLLQAKRRAIIQTHSDYGGMGTNCDGSIVSGGGIIFIQKFTKPENKIFYAIDIDDFINKRNSIKDKSLTLDMIKEIGTEYELYKIYENI
jgi:hypothetical protein